ncbi:MAG: hypothetical protein HY556_05955 [Euryarchaeota archaeon]|nr:hypothetical protein [Euryarchaeota archaeon]
MASSHTTITLASSLRDRLALLKGDMSWDEFLADVAERYPSDAAIAEMERRLSDLRERRVATVPWSKVKAKGKRSRK